MPTVSYYARGDSNTANNPNINAQNTNATPTTLLTFTDFDPDGAGPLTGDVLLDYNGGLADPDTRVSLGGGPAQTFRVVLTGFLPTTGGGGNALVFTVDGVQYDLRGARVVVVEIGTQRYFLLPDLNLSLEVSFGVINAIQGRGYTLTGTTTGPGPVVICFVAGTLILTPGGERPVEALSAGDMVLNAGGGAVRLIWVGHSHVPAGLLARHPELRPVRLPAGLFGPGLPHRPLEVSPQHRVLVEGWTVELALGLDRALVPAKHLVGDRVALAPRKGPVDYYHLLFDRHEIVVSNGLPTESLQPTAANTRDLSPEARAELDLLFPGGLPETLVDRAAAAPSTKAHEGRLIAAALWRRPRA